MLLGGSDVSPGHEQAFLGSHPRGSCQQQLPEGVDHSVAGTPSQFTHTVDGGQLRQPCELDELQQAGPVLAFISLAVPQRFAGLAQPLTQTIAVSQAQAAPSGAKAQPVASSNGVVLAPFNPDLVPYQEYASSVRCNLWIPRRSCGRSGGYPFASSVSIRRRRSSGTRTAWRFFIERVTRMVRPSACTASLSAFWTW